MIKISFGTSVGVNKIPEELKNEYRNNLCKYKKISVREPMSKEALADIVDQVEVVGDPTLLLSNKVWNHFLNKASIDKKNIQCRSYCVILLGKEEIIGNMLKRCIRIQGIMLSLFQSIRLHIKITMKSMLRFPQQNFYG